MKNEITFAEKSRFEKLRKQIKDGLSNALSIGLALMEIRDKKLYRSEFSTFEEFHRTEYQIEKSQAYRLIGAAEIKTSPSGGSLTNERQARALAKVPEEKREEVLEKAKESGSITAASIEAASKPEKQEKVIRLDKTPDQLPVPDDMLEEWDRADKLGSELTCRISAIKCSVDQYIKQKDSAFVEVSPTTVSDLMNAFRTLKRMIPYAICPTCQGHGRKKCSNCQKRGYVSQFYFDTYIAKETKEIRSKVKK